MKTVKITEPDMPRRLVRMRTVADQYDVSERTIRAWIADGLLTAYRIGPRALRLDLAEVEALIVRRLPTARRAG